MNGQAGLGFLVARYWQRRWGRAVMMLLGALVGVALLVAVLLVNDTVVSTYSAWSRSVAGSSQLEITALTAPGLMQDWVQVIRGRPGVAEAGAVVEQRSHLFRAEQMVEVNVRGVEPAVDQRLRPSVLLTGRFLAASDRDVTVLSESAADALSVNLGSVVELLTPDGLLALTVVGVYRPGGLGAWLRERVALVTVSGAQAAFLSGREVVTRVDVALAGGSQFNGPDEAAALQADLGSLLAGVAQVRRVDRAARELTAASRGLRMLLLLVGVLTLVAAGGLITSNGLALLAERSADANTLSALGVSRRRLRLWQGAEVGVLLVAGAVPGVLLGHLAAGGLMSQLPGTFLAPYAVPLGPARANLTELFPETVLAACAALLLAVVTTVLLRGLLARVAERLLRAGGAPLWLRLAAGAVGRHRLRASVTAAAVLLTVTGLVGIQGAFDSSRRSLMTWLDTAVTWDLLLGGGEDGRAWRLPLSRATLAGVTALPGVNEAAPERQVTVASSGRRLPVIALESGLASTQARLRVVQALDPGQTSAVSFGVIGGEGSVALSVPLAKRLKVGVGDQLPFSTQSGERTYTVTALVDDRASTVEAAYLDLSDYAAHWQDPAIDAIALRLEPGSNASDVALALAQRSRDAGVDPRLAPQVALAAGYRAELVASVTETYRLVRALSVLAVLVALLALVNNTVVASWQLRAEQVALRSLGAPLSLVNATLAAESVMSATLGVVAGIGAGTVLSWRITELMPGATASTWHLPVDAYALALLLVLGATAAAVLVAGSRVKFGPRPSTG